MERRGTKAEERRSKEERLFLPPGAQDEAHAEQAREVGEKVDDDIGEAAGNGKVGELSRVVRTGDDEGKDFFEDGGPVPRLQGQLPDLAAGEKARRRVKKLMGGDIEKPENHEAGENRDQGRASLPGQEHLQGVQGEKKGIDDPISHAATRRFIVRAVTSRLHLQPILEIGKPGRPPVRM